MKGSRLQKDIGSPLEMVLFCPARRGRVVRFFVQLRREWCLGRFCQGRGSHIDRSKAQYSIRNPTGCVCIQSVHFTSV